MAILLTNTQTEGTVNGIKCIVYGAAGAGKTYLCRTAPNPVIISNESGLMSLRDVKIPVIKISTFDDLFEAYTFLTSSDEGKAFDTICLDSISEIAEVILAHEKKINKDNRAAYGELQSKTLNLCRAFRDIAGKNVYFSAKMSRVQNDAGVFVFGPSMPGTKLPQDLPFLFDLVMVLRVDEDEDGNPVRWLQTNPTFQYAAKDRSGALAPEEPADLSAIFNKIITPTTEAK